MGSNPWLESVEELAHMRVKLARSAFLMLASRSEQELALQARPASQREYDACIKYLDATALPRLAPHLGPSEGDPPRRLTWERLPVEILDEVPVPEVVAPGRFLAAVAG